jgi:hypothetical protein
MGFHPQRASFFVGLIAIIVMTFGDLVTRLTRTQWLLLPTEDGFLVGTVLGVAFLAFGWWVCLFGVPRRMRRRQWRWILRGECGTRAILCFLTLAACCRLFPSRLAIPQASARKL